MNRLSWYFARPPRIGQVLIDLGFLDEDQLWDVLDEAQSTKQPTGQVAVARSWISQEQLLLALQEQARWREEMEAGDA